jgi:apolipoprotein N-acyltransferase
MAQTIKNVQSTLTIRQQSTDLLLASMTVFLFYWSFPSGGYAHLSWFVMVPLLLAIYNKNEAYVFLLALITATFGWMVSIWWVVDGLSKITLSPTNIIIPLVFVCCVFFALPYAVACWLHCRYRLSHSIFGAFQSAFIFTCLTNYLPHILPGNLAHAFYLDVRYIQLADIGGVPLVFFLIHCINFLLVNAIILKKTNPNKSYQCLLLIVIIFVTNIVYGGFRVTQFKADWSKKAISIALIQPNISIENRTREDWSAQSRNIVQMIEQINQQHNVDLLILPEIPVPVSYQYFPQDAVLLQSVIGDKRLILTAIEPIGVELTNDNGYYNTMELIKAGQVKTYRKQILLPFAEYIPFIQSFTWLQTLFPSAPNYMTGRDPTLFEIKTSQHTFNAIPLICYEAVFSELVGAGVKMGGEMLINSSNDAWFANTAGVRVHLALSLFRSIEYRKPIVRVTNTGLTAIINPAGQILPHSTIEENTQGFVVTSVSPSKSTSIYQQYPKCFEYLCWFMLILIVVTKQRVWLQIKQKVMGYKKQV